MRILTPPAALGLLTLLSLFGPRLATAQEPVPAVPAAEKADRSPDGPEAAKAPRGVVGPAAAYKPFLDLTGRYRLVEQFARRDEELTRLGAIGQYRVVIRETLRDDLQADRKDGKQSGVVRETTLDERPAEVTGVGGVGATIRRYALYRVTPDESAKADGPRPLEGLTLWYRPKPNEPPQVLCLSGERDLSDREYEILSHQLYVPGLTWLLPSYPVRVGDSWRIPRKATQALLGEPELRGDSLVGRLVELRRSDEGRTSHAILGISGRVANQFAETVVNAQAVFTFATPAPELAESTKPASKSKDALVIEARGRIAELRMGLRAASALPGPDGQLRKFQTIQELVVERTLGVPPGAAPINNNLLAAPPTTEVNSWLTHVDPKGRFRFRHPQDLLPPARVQAGGPAGVDSVVLVNGRRPEGRDLVSIAFFPGEQTPASLKAILDEQWKQTPSEILPGEQGWLPDGDWPGLKVFRLEAALKAPSRGNRAPRLHYDAYLVRFAQGPSFLVIATTTRDATGPYRQEVEHLIRSIRLGDKPPS